MELIGGVFGLPHKIFCLSVFVANSALWVYGSLSYV